MPEPTWVFEIEDSFAVGGRGTAVLGRLRGTIPSSPTVALLHAGDAERRLSEVWVEFARVRGDNRFALLLSQVRGDAVPVGSTITALEALDLPSPALTQAIVEDDVGAVASLAAADPHLSGGQTQMGMTPLMLAIEHRKYRVVEALLEAGADVNHATADGWTALHHAVDAEADGAAQTGEPPDVAIVELLLRAGADPSAVYRSPTGDETPGDLARQYGWIEAAERLDR